MKDKTSPEYQSTEKKDKRLKEREWICNMVISGKRKMKMLTHDS